MKKWISKFIWTVLSVILHTYDWAVHTNNCQPINKFETPFQDGLHYILVKKK